MALRIILQIKVVINLFLFTSMFNIIWACSPETKVAETAPIVADGSPYESKT